MPPLTIEEIVKARGIPNDVIEKARQDTNDLILAYELKQARKAAHLTQKQLAKTMGVSQKRISELENGDIELMKLKTLRRYIEGIGGNLEVRAVFPEDQILLA